MPHIQACAKLEATTAISNPGRGKGESGSKARFPAASPAGKPGAKDPGAERSPKELFLILQKAVRLAYLVVIPAGKALNMLYELGYVHIPSLPSNCPNWAIYKKTAAIQARQRVFSPPRRVYHRAKYLKLRHLRRFFKTHPLGWFPLWKNGDRDPCGIISGDHIQCYPKLGIQE